MSAAAEVEEESACMTAMMPHMMRIGQLSK